MGGLVSFGGSDFSKILYRDGSVAMGSAIPLFTGTKELTIANTYERDATLTVKQEQPFPMTLLAFPVI